MNGKRSMILGIDAFNIRDGGGVTHLTELLRTVDPRRHGFDRVFLWGNGNTLARIGSPDWLTKVHEPALDGALPARVHWHTMTLPRLAKGARCDLLFVPGGTDPSGFAPTVTMSQNMLPFEWREALREGPSLHLLRLFVLRFAQARSFRRAAGVIFLTRYAHDRVLRVTGPLPGAMAIIPHGVSTAFETSNRDRPLDRTFSASDPCRIIYVSIVSSYKHHAQVVEAVHLLRRQGRSVTLDLVGPPSSGIRSLRLAMRRYDPERAFVRYLGGVGHSEFPALYSGADIVVFASSCENMPLILLEGMSAGLPVACSNMGPMPEVLGDAGAYFDPVDATSISSSIDTLMQDPELRKRLARAALERSRTYSWERCAEQTFDFLSEVARRFKKQESQSRDAVA
jgi:glycosyltransferase involved in cell wall biosynthesis